MKYVMIIMFAAAFFACSESDWRDSGQAAQTTQASSGPEVETTDPTLLSAQGILYKDNVPFTGTLVRHYQDGTLEYRTPYRDGKEDGIAEGWYPDGSKMEERSYSNGEKSGVHRGWWENGTEKFQYYFENDLHEGELKEWYADGQIYRNFHYSHGQEEGSQQMWNDDGTIKANYVIQDGHRYGTIGTKPCRSIEDLYDSSAEEEGESEITASM